MSDLKDRYEQVQRYHVYNVGGDDTYCRDEDVAELEAKYAKLDKYCLAFFYAVCGLTCTDMTEEERADALRDANEAKSRFADDPDFWFSVDLNDDGGGDK